jgi:tyrosine-protein phosphatase SIW14
LSSLNCQLAVLSVLLASPGLFDQNPQQTSPPAELSGLHRFYRVNEHIYRSAQPSLEGLQGLPTLGIKTVIDLRGAHARSGEAQILEGLGMKYVNIPMPPLAAPSIDSVQQALALLVDPNAWPILVHCERGADRTGTVIACFRISQEGWSNQRALDEATELGMRPFEKAKKQFIMNWPRPPTVSVAPAHPAQTN